MKYRVNHTIQVEYDPPVRMARFNLRLRPSLWPSQTIDDFQLKIEPRPFFQEERAGSFVSHVSRVEIDKLLKTLIIQTRFSAAIEDSMLDITVPDLTIGEVAKLALSSKDLGGLSPVHYLYPSPLLPFVPEIAEWSTPLLPRDAPAFQTSLVLARHIRKNFVYDPDATDTDTPVKYAFAIKRGVCQDFAHIMICALRSVGLPAAYVSGYLRTIPPPGKERLVGVDDMHAWVAVWCGTRRGWAGFDPTNGCAAGSGHLTVGVGRDYADVSPIDGIFIGGGQQTVETSVDVVPVD